MKRGFTLVELLIVVAIVAIVGVAVVGRYGKDTVEDARAQMTIHEMGQIRDAFNRFWADNSAQMMGGMTTTSTTPVDLPSGFSVNGASVSYSAAAPQRFYGVMQFFERYGLWPLFARAVFDRNDATRRQIFQGSAGERRYMFMDPSPVTGDGWKGPYLNTSAMLECVLNSGGGNIVEAAAGGTGVTSGDTIAATKVRFPQPATKYDNGVNGGIYRVFYYEHCREETAGQPIYRRLVLMAAKDPLLYDTWDEIKVFAGNRRNTALGSDESGPLDLATGAIVPYDDAHGVYFTELLNFDTVYR